MPTETPTPTRAARPAAKTSPATVPATQINPAASKQEAKPNPFILSRGQEYLALQLSDMIANGSDETLSYTLATVATRHANRGRERSDADLAKLISSHASDLAKELKFARRLSIKEQTIDETKATIREQIRANVTYTVAYHFRQFIEDAAAEDLHLMKSIMEDWAARRCGTRDSETDIDSNLASAFADQLSQRNYFRIPGRFEEKMQSYLDHLIDAERKFELLGPEDMQESAS